MNATHFRWYIPLKRFYVFLLLTLPSLLIIFHSCSPWEKKNFTETSFNDTLSVTKLIVQKIRNELDNQANIDLINEQWSGNFCSIDYRVDKAFMNSQSISLSFGDLTGDSLNDVIASIEYNTGGNRPEFKRLVFKWRLVGGT